MTIPLRPQSGYLIVSKDIIPGKVGEIVLPEQHSLRPTSGTVVRPSSDLEAFYPAGTKIVFGVHAGSTFTIDQGEFTVLTENEIQCIIDQEAV